MHANEPVILDERDLLPLGTVLLAEFMLSEELQALEAARGSGKKGTRIFVVRDAEGFTLWKQPDRSYWRLPW